MLTLIQNQSKAPSGRRTPNVRTQTLAAINATWRKICPDLEGEDLRDARLVFATKALGLRKPLTSLSKCSPKQLGRIIDAMRAMERTPALPGVVQSPKSKVQGSETLDVGHATADVVHLATSAQVTAIERLRNYLGWSAIGLQNFIIDKFSGKHSPALLTPAEANSCTMILFNIAASKAIKARRVERGQEPGRVSRRMIAMEIPALKRELGIDQKPFTTEDTENGE
jgi:hypothetical protein